jgi:superfamily II DNA or RNA helicase
MYKLKSELRAWQKEAYKLWEQEKRGVIQVVTGGGKTIFAEHCAAQVLNADPKTKILILVPTITLQDQWRASLIEDLGVDEKEISSPSGRPTGRLNKFNIVVINSARSGLPPECVHDKIFLIVDECHRSGSKENSKALGIRATASLGLSATPERESDNGFLDLIAPALGGVIYSYDYKQALADGVICKYELINIKVPMSDEEQKEYHAHTKKVSKIAGMVNAGIADPNRLKLALIARNRVSIGAVARLGTAAKLALKHKGERVIIFHENIQGADALHRALKQLGANCTIYHSSLSTGLRRSNLSEFRAGTFNLLITCRALDEGMNIPETNIAIIASSTRSTRQRIQRLGRVLRPHKRKEMAQIYTLYCTDSERENLKAEESNISDEIKVAWKEIESR